MKPTFPVFITLGWSYFKIINEQELIEVRCGSFTGEMGISYFPFQHRSFNYLLVQGERIPEKEFDAQLLQVQSQINCAIEKAKEVVI
jgi:hypothetical protein